MKTNVPVGLGCCFFSLVMDLQGSKNVRAGNSMLGDLVRLPSVFRKCIIFIKLCLNRSYSSATAALSCKKKLFGVSTLNLTHGKFIPIYSGSLHCYSFL